MPFIKYEQMREILKQEFAAGREYERAERRKSLPARREAELMKGFADGERTETAKRERDEREVLACRHDSKES